MEELTPEEKLKVLSQKSEEDLHHAAEFLTTGHAILSGALARHAAREALRVAATARGKKPPRHASLEALVREAEPPPEIVQACRELTESSEKGPGKPDRYIDLGRRVVRWAARVAEG